MKEWQRTVVLLIIFCVLVGVLLWARNEYQNNFINGFR